MTKMKDAEISEPKSYELINVSLFSDNEDIITSSLVVDDSSQEPKFVIPKELLHIKNLTDNHITTYLVIKSLVNKDNNCAKEKVRELLQNEHLNTDKLNLWLRKLASEGIILFEDEIITLLI